MKKFTKEQGITLIALIITIIVMLILVAVTINVALNGGLFTRAKEAAYKTEIQQIQEQILLKKAEQMADNEINGTTGYNITLDNLDISTELKNKYRNKLSVSENGDLQYNPDNCTAEEKAYLASIGAKSVSGTTPETPTEVTYFEFTPLGSGYSFDVIKQIMDNGDFSLYVEYTKDQVKHTGNYYTGTYTYDSDENDELLKKGKVLLSTIHDFDNDTDRPIEEVISLEEGQKPEVDFAICPVKVNGEIVNYVLFISMELSTMTTNGTAGFSIPDSTLIGDYVSEDDEVINIGLSQDQTIGKFTVVQQTNEVCDAYVIDSGNSLYLYTREGILPINSGTITFRGKTYTKSNG